MLAYGREAADRGLEVIIAGAGGAAHLPGMLASVTPLPVIGVPVPLKYLDGMDSLLSIVQMPAGVPVATVGVGNARNAGLLAVRILAAADPALRERISAFQDELRETAESKGEVVRTTRPGPASSGSERQRLRHSISGQVSITIGTPAAVVRSKAASSITPSWNHTPSRTDRDRLIGELAGRRRAPEDVDHVDRERDVGEGRVDLLAQDLAGLVGCTWVDRHDALAASLEHRRDRVGRAGRVAGQTDDRPGLAVVEHEAHRLRVLPGTSHTDDLCRFAPHDRVAFRIFVVRAWEGAQPPGIDEGHPAMSARRTSRLLVTSLTTAALATTGLATVGAAPATAAPSGGSYLCEFPLFDELDVPLSLDVPDLPAELPVGIPVPAGEWDVEGALVLPDFVLTLLAGTLGVSGATHDLNLLFGPDEVPIDLTSPLDSLPAADDIDMPLSGGNRAFVPTRVGPQDLLLSDTFDLAVLDVLGVALLDVSCEWDGDDGPIGTVDVVKQTSSMKAQVAKKRVKDGKKAKVLVSVLDQLDHGATGDVVATLDGRNVGSGTLKNGATKLKLAPMSLGKHRVTLTYKGSKTVAQATKTVVVKVVKR